MSDPNDKKSDWYIPPDMAALFGIYFIVVPIVLLGGWLGPGLYNAKATGDMSAFWVALVLGAVGTVLLFFARLPLYRQHRFLTFGPHELDERHKKVYWWAYGFIAVSVSLFILLLIFLR